MTFHTEEFAHAINGVSGRMHNRIAWHDAPTLFANQQWGASRSFGKNERMNVNIRFDDNCRNGHASFSITCMGYENGRETFGGSAHDEIAKVFPELAPLIKWHLMATDGPMHYVANTVYHASNRDHNGLLAGEKRQIVNGKTKLPAWRLMAITEGGAARELHEVEKYFDGKDKPDCPFTLSYEPWWRVGEGKARDFRAARNSAIWPEATDEILSLEQPELTALLQERLPALIAEFRRDMESIGFAWSAE